MKRKYLTRTLEQAYRSRYSRLLLISYGAGIIVLLAVLSLRDNNKTSSLSVRDPFTLTQRSAVSFTLYQPAKLPARLSAITPASTTPQSGTVTLRITGTGGASATLSQQAAVKSFDHQTFRSGLADVQSVSTSLGTAYIGSADGGQTNIASMVTGDNTWILLTAPSSVQRDDLIFILQNLRTVAR